MKQMLSVGFDAPDETDGKQITANNRVVLTVCANRVARIAIGLC